MVKELTRERHMIKIQNLTKRKRGRIIRIDVIVGGDHGQGTVRFLMKLLFIMKSFKDVERESSVVYILCKKR